MSTNSIVVRLDRGLVPQGFRRSGTTWNRDHGPLVDVVDIQTSGSRDTVTLNAGVLSRPIYMICWGQELGGFIEEPHCTVRARVGQLLDNRDRWWPVSDPRSEDELAESVSSLLLPFIDRMQTYEGMLAWLASTGTPSEKMALPSICFAALQSSLGDQAGACQTLSLIETKALGGWKVRAREVAARIGCRKAGD